MSELNITKIKYIGEVIRGMSYNSDNVADKGIAVLRSNNIKDGNICEDDIVYINSTVPANKMILKNDVLICACNGSPSLVGKSAIIEKSYSNCTFGAFMLVLRSDINSYMKYVLPIIFDEHREDFFTTTICQIPMNKFQNYKFILPNKQVQEKISKYLDSMVVAIDLAIKNAENEINNVRRIKQDYISKHVISGLKSTNKKDSKNKFIGLIPSHWNIGKIKNHCYLKGRIGWQGLTADEYKDEGPYLITGTDFIDGSVNWNTCVHITEKRYEEARQIQIKNGDLLITKDGTIGKLALVSGLIDKASLNSGVMLIRNKSNEYLTKYLMYCLTSDYFWDWYNYNQRGQTSIKHLYQEQFETFQFPLPPIEEQQEIVDFLDNKCEVLDKLLEVKYMKLETLKEYKKSLIYECVTGKKEVV